MPLRRPSWNQMVSAVSDAMIAITSEPTKLMRPVPASAPAASGHWPCSQREPVVWRSCAWTSRPWRRFSTATVIAAISPNTTQLSSSAGARPSVLTREIGLGCGSEVQNGMCAVAITEPAMKAASVGIPFMAAISAPTALAISLADRANLTLVGFARDDGQAVYAHGRRLVAG